MIGLSEDQRALAEALVSWAADRSTAVRVRDAAPGERFEDLWKGLVELGVPVIAVPASCGGAGGSVVDLASGVAACAYGMVPGPLLSTATAATALSGLAGADAVDGLLTGVAHGAVTLGLGTLLGGAEVSAGRLSGDVTLLWGADATHLLLGESGGGRRWLVSASDPGVRVLATEQADLSRQLARAELRGVPVLLEAQDVETGRLTALAVTLAAAEGAGLARWALDTAVAHAKVREQFGRPIGGFQAVKHLCAEMLERAEAATAVAWDAAAAYQEPGDQSALAAAVAGSVALDAAVRNAQDCIQVLGGIGFTWEHPAHLYLRRAVANRLLVGGSDRWRVQLGRAALDGARRAVHVDLQGRDEQLREAVRRDVERVAAEPEGGRRASLVDSGLLAPYYPEPYGRAAGAVEQIVIDEELERVGVRRPDLAIGAWALPTLLEHGTDDQRERFVGPTLRGEICWCQLFSEPGAGSDLAALRTRAERVEGGWRLTGQKVWTSLAREADWAICLARTDPDAPPHQGITYFLVDMRADGIDVRPLREMTGEAVFNEVFLDGVLVPDDCVVGVVHGGWRLARTTLANERVAMSGSSLGVSVETALTTVHGRPEPPSELVLCRLGAAVADAVAVKLLGVRTTLRAVSGTGPGPESSVQKLVGVRQRQESSELALDLLGEDALAGRPGAADAWHEALLTRCLSIAGGTTQILRNVAAERVLGLPRG